MAPTTTEAEQELFHFCVVCPTAQQVFLMGEFNGWSTTATPMQRTEDNIWQLSVSFRESIWQPKPEGRFAYFVVDRDYKTGRARFGPTFLLPGTWATVVRTKEKTQA